LVERFQIAESLRLGDGQHLSFNFRDTLQAKLVNLVGGEIGGRLVTDGEAIARFSVGQGPHAGVEPSVRRVILAHEFGELRISGRDLVLYHAFDGFAQLFPVFLGNGLGDGIGELAQRLGEGTLVERVVGNLLRLTGHFFEQILRRHAVVAQSVAGISQSLNCAASSASRKLRSIREWLSFSCSGNPVTSIASKRASDWRLCSRSSAIALSEKSLSRSL